MQSPSDILLLVMVKSRAVSREFPPGNSREIPGKFISSSLPGNFSISREFSGIFYVLWRYKFLNFTIFQIIFFWLRSNFTVKKDSIQVENHCNSSKKCIFSQKRDVFDFLYSKFSVPGNSREFSGISREIDSPSQVTRPSNGQVFENRLISLG
mgnify:CR=1 FL=1